MQGIFERCLIMLLTFVLTSVKEAVLISDTICVKLLFTGEFNEFFRICHLYSLTWSEAVPHFILIFTFYIYFDCWKWKVGLKIADKKEKNVLSKKTLSGKVTNTRIYNVSSSPYPTRFSAIVAKKRKKVKCLFWSERT